MRARSPATADSTSVAMENVAIFTELAASEVRATTDQLTGLLNRRGFDLSAQASLDAAHAAGATAVLLYLDLNGLKDINDRDGHEAGDAYITAAADVLGAMAHQREGNLVARLGGDEFCALTVGSRYTGEEIRRIVEDRLAEAGVSAAVGYVEVGPQSELSLVQLMNVADERMYLAKGSSDRRRIARRPAAT